MTRTIHIGSIVVALLFAWSPTFAQTDGDRIRASVRNGQTVKVIDDQGQEFQGAISNMTTDGLIITSGGRVADLRYDQIVRIDHPNDTLKNGALIGLATGAALAVVAGLTASDPEGCEAVPGFGCGEPTTGGIVAAALLLGGLGTAVGVGIDALIHRNPEIYRRGAPRVVLSSVLGRGIGAAFVSVRW